MDISIENPAGTIRSGTAEDGKEWRSLLHFDYGYIRGTIGNDGDHVDCFIGANKDSQKVYVIHQKNVKTGKFDEDKVMLGWLTQTQAIKDYLLNYDRSDMFSSCTPMSIDDFKVKGFTKKPGMIKAHVKAHTRKTKSGKIANVRSHEDSRGKMKEWIKSQYEYAGITVQKIVRAKLDDGYFIYHEFGRAHTVRTRKKISSEGHTTKYKTGGKIIYYDLVEDGDEKYDVKLNLQAARRRSGGKLSKSQIKAHTRRSKKTGKVMHVKAHSDKRTKKTREDIIYDVGEKIGGARKDMYLNLWKRTITKDELALMEKNHMAVVKSVVKSNVIAPIEAEDAMKRMDVQAYYMYMAIKRRISKAPPDNPDARRDYIIAANRFNRVARKAKTADDFFGYLAEEAAWITHNHEAQRQEVYKKVKRLLMGDYQNKIHKQIEAYKKKGVGNLSDEDERIMSQLVIVTNNANNYYLGQNRFGFPTGEKPMTLKQGFARAVKERKERLAVMMKKVGKAKIGDSRSFDKNQTWFKFLKTAYNTRGWRLDFPDGITRGLPGKYNNASAHTLNRGMISAKWEDYTKKKPGSKIKGGFKRDVPEKVVRKGGAKIKITEPEDFMKEFGMRGVEFGNWIDVSHGNYHIQRCGEAFYDLADILKLNKKHMSINKRLAIAFGARGTGTAAAHYEPLSEAINLTKWNGGGSVAHEWMHFFDNVMAKNQGKGFKLYGSEGDKVGSGIQAAYQGVIDAITTTKEHKVTIRETAKYSDKMAIRAYRGMADWIKKHPRSPNKAFAGYIKELTGTGYNRWISKPANLKKVAGAFALRYKKDIEYTRQEMSTRTQYAVDSEKMGKDYWGSGREMFARAGEAWIQDELLKANRKNSYLVSGTRGTSVYVKVTKGDVEELNPYPAGKEREAINRAFRKLFVEVRKNKKLLKSIMMFIRMGN